MWSHHIKKRKTKNSSMLKISLNEQKIKSSTQYFQNWKYSSTFTNMLNNMRAAKNRRREGSVNAGQVNYPRAYHPSPNPWGILLKLNAHKYTPSGAPFYFRPPAQEFLSFSFARPSSHLHIQRHFNNSSNISSQNFIVFQAVVEGFFRSCCFPCLSVTNFV